MTHIRMCTTADAELIADMSRQTFFDSFSSDNTKEDMDMFLEEQFTREALIREVGAAGNIFLLAEQQSQPCGYVRLRDGKRPSGFEDRNALELARIYVVKDAIGTGIGRDLMKECIRIGIENGKDLLWLGVWEKNQRAITFYEKWGFEKFGEQVFLLGNDPQTDWLMKKDLNGN